MCCCNDDREEFLTQDEMNEAYGTNISGDETVQVEVQDGTITVMPND